MPAARFFDPEGSSLGSPTIIMEYVDGETLSAELARASSVDRAKLMTSFLTMTADIHRVTDAPAPRELAVAADWDTYIDSRIGYWSRLESLYLESNPFVRLAAAWLASHRPVPTSLSLVHGDLQAPNVVVDREGSCTAIDWEFAHIGDPREDLGWLRMVDGMSPTPLYVGDEENFCAAYRELSGLGADVINPDSVSYFSVLAMGRHLTRLLAGVVEVATGRKSSISSAYFAGVAMTALHEQWYRTAREFEASLSGAEVRQP
jgi:aminoglycoside phosphotransferase (APT) family kinase protein